MSGIFYYSNFLFILLLNLSKISGIKIKSTYELASYNYPKYGKNDEYITVAIFGTNDIHGAAYGALKTYNSVQYEVGGYKYLSGIIQILRDEFKENFLWLDAGDQFIGTYEDILTNGQLMKNFFNIMMPNGTTLGNHEWDRGEHWTRDLMKNEKVDFVLANLIPKKGIESLNDIPIKLFNFPFGIKIGVIGLTTIKTYTTTCNPPVNFTITDYTNSIKKYSKILREKGAHAVLLLSHFGTLCSQNSQDEFQQLNLRKELLQKEKCEGELPEVLLNLKNNEVDGVISGHIHETVHNWINNIPVIQNPNSGIFANIMYLTFRKADNFLDKSKTLIEGPIPICSRIFDHNKRCDIFQTTAGRKLIDYTFHSKRVKPLSSVESIFNGKFDEEVRRARNDILAYTTMTLGRNRNNNNVLANMICDVIRNFMSTDFCILNYAVIRNTWDIGPISYYDLINMFPFNNHPAKVSVNGYTLKRIIKTLQEGTPRYYQNSGLLIEIEEGEDQTKLLSVKKTNGSPIDNDKIYTLSSIDFLLKGGDKWNLVQAFFKPDDYEESSELLSSIIEKWLRKVGQVPPMDEAFYNRLLVKKIN